METKKLYYVDSHMAEFSALVLSCQETPKGFAVILDRTAFYPEGGGQAADTGTLGSVRVKDVREQEEAIVHFCEGPLTVGSTVEGIIDYDLRFDRMQQHTGEHIVSGLINARWGFHNTGFHMGTESTTIDFDGVIPAEALPEIELRANEAIWQNLAVKCWVPSPEELPGVVYRTKKALPWPVRIVQVPGYDSCACCGTHTAFTGEVGLVKLLSAVPFRGGTRIEMACGKRALNILNTAFEQNRQVSQAFSAKWQETGDAARKMNEVMAGQKYRITGLEKQIFAGIAADCAGKGDILRFEEGLDNVAVRELADAIAERCGGTAAVFSGDDENGYAFCLVARQGDLRQLGKDMTKRLNGRGGGKPNCQQGRLQASRASIETFFVQR